MILMDDNHPENVDENKVISDQLHDESDPSS